MSAAEAADPPSTLDAVRALREALRLVAASYQLTPVTITRSSDGKKRARFHENWRRDSAWSKDADQIRDWSVQHACSFAIRTGPAGGCDVVDLDGDDGILWWSERGHPLGSMVVDTISGGLHSFVAACGLPTAAKRIAPNVDTRGEGGLVFAPGAFIHGEEGTYSIRGPLVPIAGLTPLPADLVEKIKAAKPETADHPDDGRVTEHDRDWMLDRTRAAVEKVASMPLYTDGDEFRDAQMGAAMMLGRLAEVGLCTLDVARELIEEATLKVWPDGLSDFDQKNITSGLTDGPRKEHWEIRHPLSSASDALAGDEPGAYEKELERERIRRRVRTELDAEGRPPLREMSFAEFLAAPPPSYLVPKMFYRDGLSVVFGAPGAAKSFLVLDIALCLATGTRWRDQDIGRGRVHYVMAEGQATNTLRTQAWLCHRDVDEVLAEGWFVPFPEPVMLTESGVVDYLPRVERDKPDLVILDTKNLMFEGKEAQGDDYGRMLRTLHRIRTTAGGAAVVLIDHSGLHDDSRTRGSNAQKGGVETEVRVTNENGVRRAEVTRDKSGQEGTSWLYRLTQIQSVTRAAGVDAPAVCVALDPSDIAAAAPWGDRFENWNDPAQPELPEDVLAYGGPGCTAVRAMARFMRYSAGGSVGFSMAQARVAVRETYLDEKNKPLWSRHTVDRAWNALVDLNRLTIAEGGGSTSRSLWETRSGDPR